MTLWQIDEQIAKAIELGFDPETGEVLDENVLPADFLRVKTEPNTAAIKDAIKSGVDVPGAVLEDRMNIIIK